MPPAITAAAPCAAGVTLITLSAVPASGSLSFDSTVIVAVPLSSSTVTASLPACGWQSTCTETVASLLLVVPSFARYLNEAGPQTPGPGRNMKAPDGESVTAPPIADPGESTAAGPPRAEAL